MLRCRKGVLFYVEKKQNGMDFAEDDFAYVPDAQAEDWEPLSLLVHGDAFDDIDQVHDTDSANLTHFIRLLQDTEPRGLYDDDLDDIPQHMRRISVRASFEVEADMTAQVRRFAFDGYWTPWFTECPDNAVPLQIIEQSTDATFVKGSGHRTYGRLVKNDAAFVTAVYCADRPVYQSDMIFPVDMFEDFVRTAQLDTACVCAFHDGRKTESGHITKKTRDHLDITTKKSGNYRIFLNHPMRSRVWIFPSHRTDLLAPITKLDIFAGKVHVVSHKYTVKDIWKLIMPADIAECIACFGWKHRYATLPRALALRFVNNIITQCHGIQRKIIDVDSTRWQPKHMRWHGAISAVMERKSGSNRKKANHDAIHLFAHIGALPDTQKKVFDTTDNDGHHRVVSTKVCTGRWVDVSFLRYAHQISPDKHDSDVVPFRPNLFAMYEKTYDGYDNRARGMLGKWKVSSYDVQAAGRNIDLVDIYSNVNVLFEKLFTATWLPRENTSDDEPPTADAASDTPTFFRFIEDTVVQVELATDEQNRLHDCLTDSSANIQTALIRLWEVFRSRGVHGTHKGILEPVFISRSWWRYAKPLVLKTLAAVAVAQKRYRDTDTPAGKKLYAIVTAEYENMKNDLLRVAYLMMAGLVSCMLNIKDDPSRFQFLTNLGQPNDDAGALALRAVLGKNHPMLQEFSKFNNQTRLFAAKLMKDKETRLRQYVRAIHFSGADIGVITQIEYIQYTKRPVKHRIQDKHMIHVKCDSTAKRVVPGKQYHILKVADNMKKTRVHVRTDDLRQLDTHSDSKKENGRNESVTRNQVQSVQRAHKLVLSYLSTHGNVSMKVKEDFHRAVTRYDADHISDVLYAAIAYDIPNWLLIRQPKSCQLTAEMATIHRVVARKCMQYKRIADAERDPSLRAGMLMSALVHCVAAYAGIEQQSDVRESALSIALKNNINNVCTFAAMLYGCCTARLVPLNKNALGAQVVQEYQRQRRMQQEYQQPAPHAVQSPADLGFKGPDASFFGLF
jgi:hypothetical protein